MADDETTTHDDGTDETPAPIPKVDFLEPGDLDHFRLESRLEIARVLRDMARDGDLLTAYFNRPGGSGAGPTDFLLTTVLSVDTDKGLVVLDYGPDETLNRQLLEQGRATLVGNQSGVRIQFTADGIERRRLADGPAFIAPLPRSMVRVQRREFYRLRIPIAQPVHCRFHLEDGTPVEMEVLDISVGGVGVLESEDTHVAGWEEGTVIPNCRIDLPDHGTIETDIEIRNRLEVHEASRRDYYRDGCRFLHLDTGTSAQLQRYMHKVELERRRLTRG